ncbi:MAG: hypothetical protein NWQ47_06000 [Crocinitomicaceae bacterium]|jgi:hypothetical protein|nr:hypothetical protein [Crocinitomicaceae bacterium]
MCKHFLIICFLGLSSYCVTQDTLYVVSPARNTIYAELFGQSLYYSINYDRIHLESSRSKTSFTLGACFLPVTDFYTTAGSGSYNYLLGRRNHYLELGIGLTGMQLVSGNVTSSYTTTNAQGEEITQSALGSSTNYFLFLTPKIGYRFQQLDGGFFGRFTLTPPVGLISYYGPFQAYNNPNFNSGGEYILLFQEAAFFPTIIFPWAGISFGYTF